MARKIEVTPELLRGKSGELKGLRGEHEAVMSRITSLVNGLSDQWSGNAQQEFLQSYQGMQPTFTKFVEILDGYARLMDETATVMGQADLDVSNKIKSFS